MNYYNEWDPKAAAWLRELISAGLIPAGHVDTRSITDITPADLAGYIQYHFFCGIGGWPLALRLAGFPDSSPCATASCPCQPFSQAGSRKGHTDERHLWPEFMRLARACQFPLIFGEQVASTDVLGKAGESRPAEAEPVWLDGIRSDLEAAHYTFGACDLPAAGLGAPHIRQRVFWVAFSAGSRHAGAGQGATANRDGAHSLPQRKRPFGESPGCGAVGGLEVAGMRECDSGAVLHRGHETRDAFTGDRGDTGRLGDTDHPGPQGRGIGPDGEPDAEGWEDAQRSIGLPGVSGGMADTKYTERWPGDGSNDHQGRHPVRSHGEEEAAIIPGERGPNGGHPNWSDFYLTPCGDGKTRRVKSGLECLVNGLPRGVVYSRDSGFPFNPQACAEGRVMRLKGYGNAICPPLAAEFIRAFRDACHGH